MANRVTNAIRVLQGKEPRVEANNVEAKNENISKAQNGISPLSQDYFRRGNTLALRNLTKDKLNNNESLYSGYLFSALDLRKNSFAEFAEDNIITKSERESITDPYHPYLRLIEESKTSTEFEFWQDLITDWDMKGEFYIFLLRRVVYSERKLPGTSKKERYVSHIGMPTAIEVLDANTVTRLTDGLGKVLGYEQWLDDTHKRVFAPEQIIHVWNKNPFKKDQPYSIFDAAKDYQFTLNKSTFYTQAAISNNSNTPGIISTDQILNESEYDNFVARINSNEAGKIIITDGAGKVNYTPISQQLDGTALAGVTDVSRQVIFAVTGTSKTMLGIEESGTTRETARVQYQKFLQRTIAPIVKRVISNLNFDFRQRYPEQYHSELIDLVIRDDSDPQTAKEAYETQQLLFNSVLEMTYSGYTARSSEQFMKGEIGFTELELDGTDAQEIDAEALGTDQIASTEDVTTPIDSDEEFESDQDTVSEEEVSSFIPKVKPIGLEEIVTKEDNSIKCHDHHHEESLEDWIDNTLLKQHRIDNSTEYGKQVSAKLKGAYKNLSKELRAIDLEMLEDSNLVTNSLSLKDIRSGKTAREMKEKLMDIILKYMRNVMSIISAERKQLDKEDWDLQGNVNILGEKEVNEELTHTIELIANSHVDTIYNDLLKNVEKEKKKAEKKKLSLTAIALTLALQRTLRRSVKQRVPVLSENVFLRAIDLGTHWTDLLLVRQNGLQSVAFKVLRTNYSDPCEYCQKLLNKPIPLTKNFADIGTKIYGANEKNPLVVNLFPVRSNLVHVNCRCQYQLIIQNRGKREDEEDERLPFNPLSVIGEK